MAATTGPMITIFGETASGKSQLALDLAARFNGEIICADSWTVYRGFDIGTAKPTAENQARIQHHLLDITDAQDGFSVVLFKDMALNVISDIEARGKLPIMVGGTNLYINSVLYNYSFLPPVSSLVREARNKLALPELLQEAEAASINLEGIDVRNKRRVIRALESGGERPSKSQLRPNTLLLGLSVEREMLRENISKRVDKMFEQGLEAEVRRLGDVYGWDAEPMKGIGYREWQSYFDATQTIAETRERIISASMNLAKRQRTWYRRNNSIQWADDPMQAVELATTFLNNKQ